MGPRRPLELSGGPPDALSCARTRIYQKSVFVRIFPQNCLLELSGGQTGAFSQRQSSRLDERVRHYDVYGRNVHVKF